MKKAQQFSALASRWHFLLKPHNLFLLLALPLHLTFFFHAFPLQHYTYAHSNERFLHTVSATYGLMHGESEVITSDYLLFAYRADPGAFQQKFSGQIPGWRAQMHRPFFFMPRWKPCPHGARQALEECLPHAFYPPAQVVTFHSLYTAGHYSLIGYMPYMPGIAVGLLLHLQPLTTYTLSQIGNLIVMLAFAWLALRLTPVLRWPMLLLLLLPSMFAMRVFYMPDGMAIELSFLLLALILRARQRKRLLDIKEQSWLMLLSMALGLIKVTYFLLPGLCCLLPAESFSRPRHRWSFLLLAMGITIAAAGWWDMHATRVYYHPLDWNAVWDPSLPLPQRAPDTLNEGYVRTLVHYPLSVLKLAVNQLITLPGLRATFGNAGFWPRYITFHNRPMPDGWCLLYMNFLGIFALAWMEAWRIRQVLMLGRGERALIAGVLVSTILLVSMVIFVLWGAEQWQGIDLIHMQQGRYFLPVFPLFLLLLPAFHFFNKKEWLPILRNGTCIVLVAMTLYLNYLYQHYF